MTLPTASLIVRELTPRGPGAVAVLELTGSDALRRANDLVGGGLVGRELAVGDVRLLRPRAGTELLDEALVLVPATDRVELHLHGSAPVVRAVRAALAGAPWRAATLAERAEELLARAPCEAGARILLDQAEGALARELERLAALPSEAARALAAELAARGARARRALEPGRIVLAGAVNAGKSTLFNALVGERRALVSREPGTTRDLVCADALLAGWPVRVIDSAGERALDDVAPGGVDPNPVEREGQRRARAAREEADLVLWLAPARAAATEAPAGAVLLATMADLERAPPAGAISALADPAGARARVAALYAARCALPAQAWIAGEGVPFEPEQAERLERVARGAEDARSAVAALLALDARAPRP